jgi:nitrite reductase/ring-hydroxylating ferredoxin subunit
MKKILLLIVFVCLAFSCDEEIYSTIPTSPVNLFLNLDFLDNKLNANLAYEEITQARIATDRVGYGGILVINGLGVEPVNLFAYDLACPVEAQRNVRILPDNTSAPGAEIPIATTATCPKCGAVYNIANGNGTPQSGSKLFLKTYRVVSEGGGRQYRVIN